MKEYWLDTNVALRFLLGDAKELAEKARAIFQGAEEGRWRLIVHPLVVAELVYVLLRFYHQPKAAVTRVLRELLSLPGVRVLERSAVMNALERMEQSSLSFTDAFLVEKAKAAGTLIATFDADLQATGLAELPLDL